MVQCCCAPVFSKLESPDTVSAWQDSEPVLRDMEVRKLTFSNLWLRRIAVGGWSIFTATYKDQHMQAGANNKAHHICPSFILPSAFAHIPVPTGNPNNICQYDLTTEIDRLAHPIMVKVTC